MSKAPTVMNTQTYPPFRPQIQTSRSSSYSSYNAPVSLQVSTSTSSIHDQDPNERTARPGNAHAHTQFHSAIAGSSTSNEEPTPTTTTANDDPTRDYTLTTPGLSGGLTRPLKPIEQDRLAHLDRLKFFLATAPSRWDSAAANAAPQPGTESANNAAMGLVEPAYPHAPPHPYLNRFLLPNQEFVTCVLWKGLYHITGTDIVRALVFRFEVGLLSRHHCLLFP